MGRIIAIILALAAIPWVITTWWKMRRARSDRERSFIGRSNLAITMLILAGITTISIVPGRGKILAIPLFLVAAFALRHGLRKARLRIAEEDGDPVARAKRVN